jgi:hypothetical protein
MNKYPDGASIVRQIYKILSDIENLAGCMLAKVWESSEWASIVNIAEEKTVNFRKALNGKPHSSALYGM